MRSAQGVLDLESVDFLGPFLFCAELGLFCEAGVKISMGDLHRFVC